jgi:hypothetical protein
MLRVELDLGPMQTDIDCAIEHGIEQPAQCADIAQRAMPFEIANVFAVSVDRWWTSRIEYVTYNGELVTFNGDPVYVVIVA